MEDQLKAWLQELEDTEAPNWYSAESAYGWECMKRTVCERLELLLTPKYSSRVYVGQPAPPEVKRDNH